MEFWRCPEPGLPMLTRLPFRSVMSLIPESTRGAQGHGFGMDAEDRSQVFLRLAFPFGHAFDGLVLAIRLDHTKFQVPGHDGIDVEHRPAGGFDGGPDAIFFALVIDHFSDGTPGGVVNTSNTTGTDGRKVGFWCCIGGFNGVIRFRLFFTFFPTATN